MTDEELRTWRALPTFLPDFEGYCIHCGCLDFMHDGGRRCAPEALKEFDRAKAEPVETPKSG